MNEYLTNYTVSKKGIVTRKGTGKILKPDVSDRGYQRVTLSLNGKTKRFLVHRLVAELYIPNPENKTQVNHKNFDPSDNRVENLEWVTAKENAKHAYYNKPNYPSKIRNWKNRRPVRLTKDGVSKDFISVLKAGEYLMEETGNNISNHRRMGDCIRRVCKGERKSLYGYHAEWI